MDNQLWLRRSQNLYIIREAWKMWSERDVNTFYKLIGIDDSSYSAYIRDASVSNEADKKIEKQKERIINAGFKYKWFTGEKMLCDNLFGITESVWMKFIKMTNSDSLYKNVHNKIKERIKCAPSENEYERYAVVKAVDRYSNKKIARQFEKYLTEIDVKNLSESEVNELMKIADKLEEFITDLKAMNRYFEIKSRK